MMPLSKDVLDVVLLNLQRYVAPQVTTEDGKLTLFLVGYVLGFVHVEENDLAGLHAERFQALEPLLQELRSRFAELQPSLPAHAVGDARIAVDEALRDPSNPDATARAFQSALVAERNTDQDLPAWQRRFAEVESTYIEQLTDRMEYWAYGEGARTVSDFGQRQLTRDLMSGYLRGKFPEHPAIDAQSVVELPGGFAKKTYRMKVVNGPTGWDQLIIRQDAIGGPTPLSCIGEVEVLKLAKQHGIPLGEVCCVEPSDCLDAPFLLVKRVAGVSNLEAWGTRGPDGMLPGEHLAAHVAALHRIPLSELAHWDASQTPQQVIWNYIDRFEERWQRDRPIIDPLLQFGFDWLKRHVPQDIARLSIVHADISDRNILVDNGTLTAIIDWELWHVGDPMYDLAYIKPFIERSMPWQRFVDIYEANGCKVSMANDDYWYIFSEVRNSAMLASGLRTFMDRRNRNLKTIAPVMGQYRNRLRLGMRRLLPLLGKQRPAGGV